MQKCDNADTDCGDWEHDVRQYIAALDGDLHCRKC